MENNEKFYLGRIFVPQNKQLTDTPLLYDPDDLTTHAFVVGMTGSGKTGLCIDLLEEAALQGIPSLMIDPKGDITNTLLHFPELRGDDFAPWVNPDQARRDGKNIAQAGQDAADLWKKGLSQWDIEPQRIRALSNSAHFSVYTPGSDAGIPISILASLKAPQIPWEHNKELIREKISGTVTALLGLVGLTDIDPVRSREHILLSNIFESAWSQNKDLDLGELIMQTQTPPFDKLGVFDINAFFPAKERFELAMLLNNILAAPAFQTWIEGQPLDIASLLYAPDGRPRHSVFYIAHLGDAERMFFVTLLFSAIETWMRAKSGSTSLRALVYFDEIFGYLPPISNPPSKRPMLRMLKQARAFGVGLVLATQNPVDIDYKALSNTGSWFIGKLQTDKDKERLLDGLESASAGNMNRGDYDRLISALGKRVFLLHNVHEKQPVLFNTRWAMNYLTGPLTRTQIPALNTLAGAELSPDVPAPPSSATPPRAIQTTAATATPPAAMPTATTSAPGSATRPTVPGSVGEYFLPNNLTLTEAAKAIGREIPLDAKEQGLLYRPVLLAQASVRFLNRKYKLDYEDQKTALVIEPDRRGVIRWEEFESPAVDARSLDRAPAPNARFAPLEAPLSESKFFTGAQRDFKDWIYRTLQIAVRSNETLKVYAGPEVSKADFRKLCSDAARQKRDAEKEKALAKLNTHIQRMKDKLAREQRELTQDEAEYQQRKMEELGTHAENLASLIGFGRKRSLTTSLTKRRLTEQAKADVEESHTAIAEFEREIEQIKQEVADTLAEIDRKWSDIVEEESTIPVNPYKKDILVDLFGVAWMPYHLVESNNREIEIPGFASASPS